MGDTTCGAIVPSSTPPSARPFDWFVVVGVVHRMAPQCGPQCAEWPSALCRLLFNVEATLLMPPWPHNGSSLLFRIPLAHNTEYTLCPMGAPQAQCARSATIWASGRTRDPYFEILGAPRGIMVTRSGGFEFRFCPPLLGTPENVGVM